jgi:hypothetical protein
MENLVTAGRQQCGAVADHEDTALAFLHLGADEADERRACNYGAIM